MHARIIAAGVVLFSAACGRSWSLGSVLLGLLCEVSLVAMVGVTAALEVAGVPFLLAAARRPAR